MLLKELTRRIQSLISNIGMFLPINSSDRFTCLHLIMQAKDFVENVYEKKPTVLVYSPTIHALIKSLELDINALGMTILKEPRIPNDQMILMAGDAEVAVFHASDEEFISFLNAPFKPAVSIGDIYPPGNFGEPEAYTDTEYSDCNYGGYEEEYGGSEVEHEYGGSTTYA